MIAKCHVFPCVIVHDQAFALAIFGDVRDAAFAPRPPVGFRACQVDGLAVNCDCAAAFFIAAKHFEQFGLPVAGHACDPKDFTSTHVEADVFDAVHAFFIGDIQVLYIENDVPHLGWRFLNLKRNFPANHQFGQLLRACF